jgi:hypothetical protein
MQLNEPAVQPPAMLRPACSDVRRMALAAGHAVAELRLLLAGQTEQHLNARLSRRYFAHLLARPLGFHTDRSTGVLSNGLVQATAGCQMGLNSVLQCIPVRLETLTVPTVLTHFGQPARATIFAASAGAHGLVFAWGANRLRAHGRHVSQAGQQLHGLRTDTRSGPRSPSCEPSAGSSSRRWTSPRVHFERHRPDQTT